MNRKRNLFLAFILLVFLFPKLSQAKQFIDLQAGDLIKIPNNPAVYYYGYDGKRHVFPNEVTYFSWYKDFSRVKIISPDQLKTIPFGKNIVIRPGTFLVKFDNNPKIYAVEPMGVLRHITSPELAQKLYGPGWGHRIAFLPEYLFADYREGAPLRVFIHPTGTIFRYKGDQSIYIVANNYARKILLPAKWENYHFRDDFILILDKNIKKYERGYDLDGFRAELADTAQTLIADLNSEYSNYIKTLQSKIDKPIYPSESGTGLTGYYFKTIDLSGDYVKRIDKNIAFDFGVDPPMSNFPENFSVRWKGTLEVPKSGVVKFYTISDDGVRLYIDDKLVIDNWSLHSKTKDQGQIYLEKGFHKIELEYFDALFDAVIYLGWNLERYPFISTKYLYPEE